MVPKGLSRWVVGLLLAAAWMAALTASAFAETKTEKFTYTGKQQEFVVPTGVTSVHVEAVGAQGGPAAGEQGGAGGRGAVVSGAVNVKPGTLYVDVGGPGKQEAGGFNGGANGGNAFEGIGGGGGGASDVRTVSGTGEASLKSRLLVAAGGGGGGGTDFVTKEGEVCGGGAGGDAEVSGEPGANCGFEPGGGGGSGETTKGGAGGKSYFGDTEDESGAPGGLGGGGGGYETGGGGGGGGLYGGGGGGATLEIDFLPWEAGGAGGGGGGSNLVPEGGSAALAEKSVEPSVTISYTVPVLVDTCTSLSGYGTINRAQREGAIIHNELSLKAKSAEVLEVGIQEPALGQTKLTSVSAAACVTIAGGHEYSVRGPATLKGKHGYSEIASFAVKTGQVLFSFELLEGATRIWKVSGVPMNPRYVETLH